MCIGPTRFRESISRTVRSSLRTADPATNERTTRHGPAVRSGPNVGRPFAASAFRATALSDGSVLQCTLESGEVLGLEEKLMRCARFREAAAPPPCPPVALVRSSLLLGVPWSVTTPSQDAVLRFPPNDIRKPATPPRSRAPEAPQGCSTQRPSTFRQNRPVSSWRNTVSPTGRVERLTSPLEPPLRTRLERRPTSHTNDAHPVVCRIVSRATRNGCELSYVNNTPRRSHRNPPSENPDARGDSRPPRANTRLDPCRSHATATSLHRPRVTPRKQRLQRPRLPAHPIPRPTPGPFLPANPPLPLRGKAKARDAARGAPLRPNHSSPEPQDRPHRLAIPLPYPLRCVPRCLLPHPARTLLPPPSAFGARDSRARPFRPSPSLRARNAPCIASSRHRLPPVPIVLSCSLPRATPSSGCLPPPASRSPAQPPPASSYERSPTRSPPVPHRPITAKRRPSNEPSKYLLRVRL